MVFCSKASMGLDLIYVEPAAEQACPTRYSQATLQNVLQFAGCKARVAVKVGPRSSICCSCCTPSAVALISYQHNCCRPAKACSTSSIASLPMWAVGMPPL